MPPILLHRAGLLAVVCVTAALTAGCGGAEDSHPPGSPRAPVLALLDDVIAGRYAQACDRLAADADLPPRGGTDLGDDIRKEALVAVHLPTGTSAQRMAFLRRLDDATQTCTAGVQLRAGQLGARLRAVRREAATAPLHAVVPHAAYEWADGTGSENPWMVMAYHGHWAIVSTHGL